VDAWKPSCVRLVGWGAVSNGFRFNLLFLGDCSCFLANGLGGDRTLERCRRNATVGARSFCTLVSCWKAAFSFLAGLGRGLGRKGVLGVQGSYEQQVLDRDVCI
jgi:hypothetical protein